ncbi:hypothetical protein N0V84_008427 [Fusarium piperis]|uniref:Uncharacterized protein n=1 Tax=Fusarium piperis TaxID=1435070 RepID=A0A9W8W882_9HYPO|nr:hypothetical protein N0V84_008427 [Fusarium piperis]
MSGNIDPHEAKKRAVAMDDLHRLRQEDLPLSTEEKRGPSFNPTGRNGTDHINPSFKEKLSNKWGGKIDDEESRQTEGLEIGDARPWAKKTAQDSRVQGSVGQNSAPSVTLAQWGPQNTTLASEQPPAATQEVEAVCLQVKHESNGNVSEAAVTAPPSTNLEFVLSTKALDPTLAEHVIGTGQCQVVPGKDEAFCFPAEVVMKLLISENRAVLELSAPGKPHRILDALELGDPIIDGQFCAFTQLSNRGLFHLRFANDTENKKFKRNLVKMQKSARALQPQENTREVKQQQANQQEVNQQEVNQQKVNQQQLSPTNQALVASLAILNEGLEPLIPMNGWTGVKNLLSPNLENATRHVVASINQLLGEMTLKELVLKSANLGIEQGIIDHWVQNGFLRGDNDSLKDKFFQMLQSMVRVQIGILRRNNGEFDETDQNVQQATQGVRNLTLQDAPRDPTPTLPPRQRTVSHQHGPSAPASQFGSQLDGRQGLSASRYASGPVQFQNCFTGPRIKRDQDQ